MIDPADVHSVAWWSVSKRCPLCGSGQLLVRSRRDGKGKFVACSGYPACNYSRNYSEPKSEEQLAAMADLAKERDELQRQVLALQKQIAGRPAAGSAAESKDQLRRRVRKLAIQFHPDRHPQPVDPAVVTSALYDLMKELE